MSRKPWWSDGVRFECQETGRCCVSRGSYGFVYVTLEDRRRLARHLGLSTREFTTRHCIRTEGHFHLKDFTDACPYLEGKRCGVYEARPTQCRTWPFWPENVKNESAWNKAARKCHGMNHGDRHFDREQIEALRDAEEWPKDPPSSSK